MRRVLVLPDADVRGGGQRARSAAKFRNAGQVLRVAAALPGRSGAGQAVRGRSSSRRRGKAAGRAPGLDPASRVRSDDQRRAIARRVEGLIAAATSAGATVRAGGKRPGAPRILSRADPCSGGRATSKMPRPYTEEIFGPLFAGDLVRQASTMRSRRPTRPRYGARGVRVHQTISRRRCRAYETPSRFGYDRRQRLGAAGHRRAPFTGRKDKAASVTSAGAKACTTISRPSSSASATWKLTDRALSTPTRQSWLIGAPADQPFRGTRARDPRRSTIVIIGGGLHRRVGPAYHLSEAGIRKRATRATRGPRSSANGARGGRNGRAWSLKRDSRVPRCRSGLLNGRARHRNHVRRDRLDRELDHQRTSCRSGFSPHRLHPRVDEPAQVRRGKRNARRRAARGPAAPTAALPVALAGFADTPADRRGGFGGRRRSNRKAHLVGIESDPRDAAAADSHAVSRSTNRRR